MRLFFGGRAFALMFTAVLLSTFAGGVAHGQAITTTFAGGNFFTRGANYFDVTIASNDLSVTSLDVNVAAGAVLVNVYTKVGTYVGSTTNAAAWTLQGQVAVTGAGAGNATSVNLTPFLLSANTTYGFYVSIAQTVAAIQLHYTNGTNTYSNTDLSLTAGAAQGALFGGTLFTSRTWNGTIHYTVVSAVPEPSPLVLGGLTGLAGLASLRFRRRV